MKWRDSKKQSKNKLKKSFNFLSHYIFYKYVDSSIFVLT